LLSTAHGNSELTFSQIPQICEKVPRSKLLGR
jgi:hypothetical protein